MLQNHPQQILHSPARLGLPNPNSPSTLTSTPKLSSSSSQQQPQQLPQQTPAAAATITTRTPSTLLSFLPPLPRAQSLLLQMASLATKLFEVSPNRSLWLSSFRGSLPVFLPSSSATAAASSTSPSQPSPADSLSSQPSSTKEVLTLFTSLQTHLFEAVAELQEILDLQDAKLKICREVRSKDAAIFAFAKKLREAQRVLDVLADDYAHCRPRAKRYKLSSSTLSPPHDNLTIGTAPGLELNLSDILSYAHRISYTTFAPPEFGSGQAPLRGALPPAPQEEQMRASQLYAFSDLDVGLPKTVETKEKTVASLIEPVQPPPSETPLVDLAAIQGMLIPPPLAVPSGWRPGMPVELPSDFPLVPPPGWKPGDRVPLPPLDAFAGPKKDEESRRFVQMPGAPLPPKAPETHQVKYVQLDINPDHEEYSSDYSDASSEEDDEE